MFGPLLDVQMSFRLAGARDSAPCQKWAKRVGFVAVSKVLTGVGHVQRIWQDAFSAAGAVQQTCSSEMLGSQGADFLRRVAFWSTQDHFVWQVQHFVWPGITFSWQAQYFRDMDWKNRKTHWYEAVRSASNFPYWRKSRRIASFLMLPTAKIEEVSQNCFGFAFANLKNWGSLAELLRFQACKLQIDR